MKKVSAVLSKQHSSCPEEIFEVKRFSEQFPLFFYFHNLSRTFRIFGRHLFSIFFWSVVNFAFYLSKKNILPVNIIMKNLCFCIIFAIESTKKFLRKNFCRVAKAAFEMSRVIFWGKTVFSKFLVFSKIDELVQIFPGFCRKKFLQLCRNCALRV